MNNIDKKILRTWSMLGQRGTFGVSLLELAKENDKIFGLSADLCKTSGMDRFASEFSDRFINVGIAEQNMIGIASGIADSGYIPYVTTFANFATLRANEQVRHFMAYMKSNVKLVGFGAGFAMELFGNTHYGLEDISVINSFPNITILSPADCFEVYKAVYESSKIKGPVYIRLSGKMGCPIIHKDDFVFQIGKNIEFSNGNDIIIFATGMMVKVALDVLDLLNNDGISATVVDVHTLKPFDNTKIEEYIKAKLLVSIEEHSIIGGLGSIIANTISGYSYVPKLLKFGTGDQYEMAGDYDYMLNRHGLYANNIFNKIKFNLK